MNDLHHPCEPWAERISLAAAGCLPTDEEREVREHVETCSVCRERFLELTELCRALVEAQLPVGGDDAAIVERVMSAVASDTVRSLRVRTQGEMIHRSRFSRSLDKWRWIMRSPVSRVAAAVVSILAVTGIVLWLHSGGATLAIADFVKPILEAKTAKYKMTYERDGHPQKTSVVMVLAPCRIREESTWELPGEISARIVMIQDLQRGKILSLDTKNKTATVYAWNNMPEGMGSANWFDGVRRYLLDPRIKREPLGEKEIDGQRVVGYRHGGYSSSGQVMNVWGDPETGLPVRIETIEQRSGKEMKVTMSDFVFNVDLDESLFSVEPRPGYTLQHIRMDSSLPEEKDLINTLLWHSQQRRGAFPDSLDLETVPKSVSTFRTTLRTRVTIKDEWKDGKWQSKKISEETSEDVSADTLKESEQQRQRNMDALQTATRGQSFVRCLPPNATAHYAGKGVSLGAVDRPIFWYRPKDSQKYRVIYGDLSVRDADTPPNSPNAQPVPGTAEPKKK
jgi:outer membrane lipoprotein-sorting protein